MRFRLCVLLAVAAVLFGGEKAQGQVRPGGATTPSLTLKSLRVEGVDGESMRNFVRRTTGLKEGQEISLAGGDVAEAIRAVYRSGLFSDVTVMEEDRDEGSISLLFRVLPEPSLAGYSIRGIKDGHRDDLKERISLVKGRPVRPGDIERAKQAITSFYSEEGYRLAEVSTTRKTTDDDELELTFHVDPGKKVEVENITFTGNAVFSDRRLRRRMDETKEDRWWRFWKSETFDEEAYASDLQRIIDYYNQKGYYDATVVSDSVYATAEGDLAIDIRVREGEQYHIRNVEWQGNTVYPDRVLTQALGFEKGEVYDSKKLQTNLRSNPRSTDVTSLYTDRGYVRFRVQENVRVVGEDSLDLSFELFEGDVYEVGNINITGNTKTKEHVIRRELYTIPGQTFRRSDVRESIRRLSQLSYFSKESLSGGPGISVNDQEKTVDLTYKVEEVSTDQLELSGTYGGYGLVLQLSFSFNNFSAQNLFNGSAWTPLPSGDGQKLSVSVRTSGFAYQNYSISFTEPWFRGRPTPVGGSVSYSRISRRLVNRRRFRSRVTEGGGGIFSRISTQAFRRQRLKWPDDKFNISSSVNYNYYNNSDGLYSSLPEAKSHQFSFEQGISRNSLNNPLFPTRGSKVELSLEVAPPLGNVQFHKWRFKSSWNVPLSFGGKLALNVSTDYGYIGSLTGDEVQFQRFDLGGSPFDYGRYVFGSDPVFMRGYPAQALNPIENNRFAGGRILNKYTSELRLVAVQSQQLQAAPYLFLDAANTWNSFDTYNPARLYRSAGIGARLFLPIVGLIEVNYGYNFDRFADIENGSRLLQDRSWRFQFSFGRSLTQ